MKIRVFGLLLLLTSCLVISGCNSSNSDASSHGDNPTDVLNDSSVGITIDGFTNFDNTIAGKIPNSQETFSFGDNVHASKGCTWKIYRNLAGSDEIVTKTIECSIGDNTVYLFAQSEKESKLYTIIVRRRAIYNVDFDGFGTINIEEDSLINVGDAPVATKTGYTFSSWDYDFTKPVESDLFIKANWKANKYRIILSLNGGTISGDVSFEVEYDSTVSLNTPTYVGRFFEGWYLNETRIYNSFVYNYDHDITLNAKWNNDHNISFNLDGGFFVETQRPDIYGYVVHYEEEYILPTVEKDGYSFSGWELSNGTKLSSTGLWNIPDKNTQLNATWSKSSYQIIYDLDGGTQNSNNPSVYTVDSPDIILENPNKAGFVFGGWFQNGIKVSTIKSGSYGNISLKAKWVSSVMTFDGTHLGSYPQTIEEDPTIISELEKLTSTNSKGYYVYNGQEYKKQICIAPYAGTNKANSGTYLTADEYYYVRVEPIKWITIGETDDELLLTTSTIIDCDYYENTNYSRYIHGQSINASNYAYSYIRDWLNGEFYSKSFSDEEKVLIKNKLVDNSDVGEEFTYPNTYDNVFLLHRNEVMGDNWNYFSSETNLKVSDMVHLKGKYLSSNEHYYPSWYLRSGNYSNYTPSQDTNYVWWTSRGNKIGVGSSTTANATGGIRPAIRIAK